jgi:hypothetical protein
MQPRTGTNRRTVRAPPAPNRLGTGSYGHKTKGWVQKWLIRFKTPARLHTDQTTGSYVLTKG